MDAISNVENHDNTNTNTKHERKTERYRSVIINVCLFTTDQGRCHGFESGGQIGCLFGVAVAKYIYGQRSSFRDNIANN